MADLCRRFLDEHSSLRNKQGTFYNYHRMIDRFYFADARSRRVIEVSRGDVLSPHHQLRDTPYQANRVLGLVSKMMNMAERWGLREDGSNPTRHVPGTSSRALFVAGRSWSVWESNLKEAERAAMGNHPDPVTPLVRMSVVGDPQFRWPWVNLERKRLELPDSKTGSEACFPE